MQRGPLCSYLLPLSYSLAYSIVSEGFLEDEMIQSLIAYLGLTHDQLSGILLIAGILPVTLVSSSDPDRWAYVVGTSICAAGNLAIAIVFRDMELWWVPAAYGLYTVSWTYGTIRSAFKIRKRLQLAA